jgi:hypothetical protein
MAWKKIIDSMPDKASFKKILNARIEENSKISSKIDKLAESLAAKEKATFRELYSYFKRDNTSNPCSEFLLK